MRGHFVNDKAVSERWHVSGWLIRSTPTSPVSVTEVMWNHIFCKDTINFTALLVRPDYSLYNTFIFRLSDTVSHYMMVII